MVCQKCLQPSKSLSINPACAGTVLCLGWIDLCGLWPQKYENSSFNYLAASNQPHNTQQALCFDMTGMLPPPPRESNVFIIYLF